MDEKGLRAYIDSGKSDKYITDHLSESWTALLNGEIIGQSVHFGNLIDFMIISLPYQRMGYGGELLMFSEQMLSIKHKELVLECFETNSQANAFYVKHHWNVVDRFIDPILQKRKIKYSKNSMRAPNGLTNH